MSISSPENSLFTEFFTQPKELADYFGTHNTITLETGQKLYLKVKPPYSSIITKVWENRKTQQNDLYTLIRTYINDILIIKGKKIEKISNRKNETTLNCAVGWCKTRKQIFIASYDSKIHILAKKESITTTIDRLARSLLYTDCKKFSLAAGQKLHLKISDQTIAQSLYNITTNKTDKKILTELIGSQILIALRKKLPDKILTFQGDVQMSCITNVYRDHPKYVSLITLQGNNWTIKRSAH